MPGLRGAYQEDGPHDEGDTGQERSHGLRGGALARGRSQVAAPPETMWHIGESLR